MAEHRFEGYRRDAGTVESYWESHMDLLGDAPVDLLGDAPAFVLHGGDWVLHDGNWHPRTNNAAASPARVHRGADISTSLLSSVLRGGRGR